MAVRRWNGVCVVVYVCVHRHACTHVRVIPLGLIILKFIIFCTVITSGSLCLSPSAAHRSFSDED